LDYDVHHGDGTQKLVNENKDDDIYFCSLHCYEKGFYPESGSILENTEKNINVPFPRNQSDENYIEKFNNVVVPFLKKTNPDIIIISNGLDAHKDDPMNIMKLTDVFYEYVTKYLKSLNLPLLYILEGGYNPNVIANVSYKIINLLL
jgi:acetoin utilization deacetylase AcuC-like enzyme